MVTRNTKQQKCTVQQAEKKEIRVQYSWQAKEGADCRKMDRGQDGAILVVPFLVHSPKRATSVSTEEALKYMELYNPHGI